MTEMPRIGKKEVFIVVGFSDKTPDALFYCMIPPKKILTSNHFLPFLVYQIVLIWYVSEQEFWNNYRVLVGGRGRPRSQDGREKYCISEKKSIFAE